VGRKIRSRQRTLIFILFVLVFVLLSARLYMAGMRHLEGVERGFWQSLMTVVESMTTTGFGNDSSWHHPVMNVFVVFFQIMGLIIVLLIFPLFFIPFFEKRFEQRLPSEAPDLNGHVLIYNWSRAVSSVMRELERSGQAVLVLEEDEAEARRLVDLEHRVIHRPLDDEALEAAGLLRARTVIANGSDEQNATLALSARQMGFEGEILSLVTDPTHLEPLMKAGSSEVLTPRNLLAVALAARASEKVSPTIAGAHQLGQHLEVFQIRVQHSSKIAGLNLRQAEIGARTGTIVIGQWVEGRLETAPSADMIIQPRGILVVAGSHENIEKLIRLAEGARPLLPKGPIVVVGHGEVGSQVIELLREVGENVKVIDAAPGEDVDLVGDILDSRTVDQATLELAQAVVLAIDSDSATLFATVLIRDRSSSVPILARINETENLEKIHRAGADFALSFSQVAGSLLASRLLGQHTFELDPQLKLLKVNAAPLAGQHPVELDIRGRTGCSVVAVERGDELFTEFDQGFSFEARDDIYICGSPDAAARFQANFDV